MDARQVGDEMKRNEATKLNDTDLEDFFEEVIGNPDIELDEEEDELEECEGHESLRGDYMGKTFYCDGSCRG